MSGKDCATFINNVSTFHISKLNNNLSERGLFLNKFGKILTDAYLYKVDEFTFYLVVFEWKYEQLKKHLSTLVLLNDIRIEEIANFKYIANWCSSPPLPHNELINNDIIIIDGVIYARGYYVSKNDRFFIPDITFDLKEIVIPDEDVLRTINCTRLKNKIPYAGVDFDSDTFANEISEWIPIDISKGCFIGQEYIARVKFRGKLHKKLVYFSGKKCLVENATENKIVEMRSSFLDSATDEMFGFGYLNIDFVSKQVSAQSQ
ncbi:MAG: hypothetical protein ACK4NF_02905 [Planctomycetota bacterium]